MSFVASSRERSAFFVADADPLDLAVAYGVGERIQRISDQSEYLPDASPFEHIHQSAGYCL